MFAIYELAREQAFPIFRTNGLDIEFGKVEQLSMTIAEYRASIGLSLDDFAAQLGLKSKGHVSEIERANTCSAKLALAIEAHSNGLVDAADLNADVAAARQVAA